MKLPGRVSVDVAIETRHAQAGIHALAVVGGIEFFLREWCEQQPEPVELHGRQDVLEEAVIVVDRNDLTARDVSELGPRLEIDRWRKLRQERFGQIEINVESLEPWKHRDLHFGKHLAPRRVLGMRQRRIREYAGTADLGGAHPGEALPCGPLRQSSGWPHAKRLAA